MEEPRGLVFMVKELINAANNLLSVVEDPHSDVGTYCNAIRRAKNAIAYAEGRERT